MFLPSAGEGSSAIDFEEQCPDPSLSCEGDLNIYLAHVFMPWRMSASGLVVAAADDSAQSAACAHYGADIALIFIPRREIVNAIEQRFRSVLLERSVFALKNARPEFSAQRTFTAMQLAMLAGIPLAAVIAFYAMPTVANAALAVLFVVGYLANAAFRATLVWIGPRAPTQAERARVLPQSTDADLPLYSILVPLYREANVMPSLAAALCRLAYPRDRLDIKLILEADDCDTIAAARAFECDPMFEIICVPPGGPRTKPRACNYAVLWRKRPKHFRQSGPILRGMESLGNKYALAALKDRRARLAGEIAQFKKKLAWAASQLEHVDACIAIFDPAFDIASIGIRRPKKRVKLFRQGELGRMILDALRRSEKPLGLAAIVGALLASQGHEEAARPALTPRVRGNLAYLERGGKIEKSGKARSAKWALK